MVANCSVILIDVETNQDDLTGIRDTKLVSITKLIAEKSSVGTNTYWNATANNINLDMSLIIRRRSYKNQKYIFLSNEIYEVYNTSKSYNSNDIVVNVKRIKNPELKELVISAMELI